MKRRITVLGTGRMGSVLALALVAQGHSVTVWNRTASKAKPLDAKGARVAASVEEAIAEAEIVVGNVSDYDASAALLAPAAVTKALADKLFVQLATGTPRQAREMASWAREHRARYLDGAIMATPNFIGQAGCTIVYAGESALFEATKPVLMALGGNPLHVGTEIGHANTIDAAVLSLFWASLFGTWQAAAICEAEGFPLDVLSRTVSATIPVVDGALRDSIERIAKRRFVADETTMSAVDPCYASVRHIHEISKEHAIHLGLAEALETIFRRAIDAGRGTDDMASVYQGMKLP